MRYSSILIILFFLGACNYRSLDSSAVTSPSVEREPIPRITPSLRSVQATSTSGSNLREEGQVENQTVTDRALENGLPLAARVNDQPIFLKTYEKQVTQVKKELKRQGIDLASDDGRTTLRQLQKQVLEGLLAQLIIEQQASDLGLMITEEEVEAKAQEAIAQLQDQAQFEEWLAGNDLNYQEFLIILHSQLVANKVFEHITRDVPDVANQIQLRYILVEEQLTAQTIIEELKSGVNFAGLAQQHSLAEDTKDEPRWFPKGAGLLPSDVEILAFSLQPGEVSGPIETSQGFYIIKLENKEADRPLTLDMLQTLKKQIFDNWLNGLKSSSAIEIYVTS